MKTKLTPSIETDTQPFHHFPKKVSSHFERLSVAEDPNDPIRIQFEPNPKENIAITEEKQDPTGEQAYLVVPGLIHKYKSVALIITTANCPIHCRYCFRKNFPYHAQQLKNSEWQQILRYISQHPEIDEIILSGGDPLSLSNHKIKQLCRDISNINHIRQIRMHSRFPIVDPARIDRNFIDIAKQSKLKTIVVHCNHPQELSIQSKHSLQLLASVCVLLNQSVLLRGVNDNAMTLKELSYKLFDHRVLPYYLHILDRVNGTAHFDINRKSVFAIYRQLKTELPGYLLPKLVRDNGGTNGKQILGDLIEPLD